jgi:2-polyprenyl-6-methoxyphenol hydroxylase-like FAD-dependent oxidoreductase
VGNSRQADRYRDGRVLLAGDAAHVFSAGGAALNAGLNDALALAATLTTAMRVGPDEAVLDDYHAQRHAAGQRTLAHTRVQHTLETADHTGDALRDVFADLLEDRSTARRIATLIEG